MTFFFQPADMVNQVLNLGLPAPIDVQVAGTRAGNFDFARALAREIARIPGAVDVRVQQVMDAPELRFTVDRTKAQQIGLSQRDVSSDLLISLSSSGQTAPNFWLDPRNGVQYGVSVMTPQYRMGTMEALRHTPVTVPGQAQPQLFGNLATSTRGMTPAVVNHYNVQPVFNVYASADRRDLGGVAREIDKVVERMKPQLPEGVAGDDARTGGKHALVVHRPRARDRVRDPARVHRPRDQLPELARSAHHHHGAAGCAGGDRVDAVRHAHDFTVPSLMGAIMAMGVATANSVLLITFADDQRRGGRPRAGSGDRRGFRAAASGVHDGAGDDHRHAADGTRPR